MMNKFLTGAAVAAAVFGLAASAHADFTAKDVGQILKWPTALRQAVKTAETNAKGSAFEAMSSLGDGTPAYIVNVMADGKLMTVKIDPKTDKVASTTPDTADHASDYADLAKLKTTLDDAIKAAERAAKGKAIGADFKSGAAPAFEVQVAMKDDTVKTVTIDAKTGKVEKIAGLQKGKPASLASAAKSQPKVQAY